MGQEQDIFQPNFRSIEVSQAYADYKTLESIPDSKALVVSNVFRASGEAIKIVLKDVVDVSETVSRELNDETIQMSKIETTIKKTIKRINGLYTKTVKKRITHGKYPYGSKSIDDLDKKVCALYDDIDKLDYLILSLSIDVTSADLKLPIENRLFNENVVNQQHYPLLFDLLRDRAPDLLSHINLETYSSASTDYNSSSSNSSILEDEQFTNEVESLHPLTENQNLTSQDTDDPIQSFNHNDQTTDILASHDKDNNITDSSVQNDVDSNINELNQDTVVDKQEESVKEQNIEPQSIGIIENDDSEQNKIAPSRTSISETSSTEIAYNSASEVIEEPETNTHSSDSENNSNKENPTLKKDSTSETIDDLISTYRLTRARQQIPTPITNMILPPSLRKTTAPSTFISLATINANDTSTSDN